MFVFLCLISIFHLTAWRKFYYIIEHQWPNFSPHLYLVGVAFHLDQFLVADAKMQVQLASYSSMSYLYASVESVIGEFRGHISLYGGICLDSVNSKIIFWIHKLISQP